MNTDRPEGLDLGALALLLIAAAVVTVARGLAPLIALALALLPQRPRTPRTPRTAATLAPPPQEQAAAVAPVRCDLQALTVAQLRPLARAAGHRALARSGRRAQLLEALARGPP